MYRSFWKVIDFELSTGDPQEATIGRLAEVVEGFDGATLRVRYDQLEGMRFRHTVQFERWRPDRDPASCTYDQLVASPQTCYPWAF